MNATVQAPQDADRKPVRQPESSHESIDLRRKPPLESYKKADVQRSEQQVAVPPVEPPLISTPAMDKGRFVFGMLLSAAGIATLLFIAAGALQQSGIGDRFSMPIVACIATLGIMMLSCGFGLMATAAAGFDDGEFERLMDAGNISAVEVDSTVDKTAAALPGDSEESMQSLE